MSLRHKLYASVSIPSGVAIALLYLAAVAGSEDGKWLFRMGITFAVLALVCGRVTWISHQQRTLEDKFTELMKDHRALRRDLLAAQETIDSQLAVTAWQQAFGRIAQRDGTRHLYAARNEDG